MFVGVGGWLGAWTTAGLLLCGESHDTLLLLPPASAHSATFTFTSVALSNPAVFPTADASKPGWYVACGCGVGWRTLR